MRYIATYLIYIAVITRAIGWNYETFRLPTATWVLLALIGVLLFTERAVTRRLPIYPRVYTAVQSLLVISMLYLAPTTDFLTMLLMPLSFQAVQFFPGWVGYTWIGVFSLAMSGMFFLGLEWQSGLTMLLATTGADVLMGSFAHLIARTEKNSAENQRLFVNLQETYRRLKDSASQAEALSAARERHRLVRELHDSLTQTLFSMNLAVQSAQLAILDSPRAADEHILRLQALARSATSEVQALTGKVSDRSPASEGLVVSLRKLAAERLEQDGLEVILEVTGQRVLPRSVEAGLFRITQEALNNITRHAGVRQAKVRVCLEDPIAFLEIIDHGCGFSLRDTGRNRGIGLAGMAERATEIGWELVIKSQPGQGTIVKIEARPT